VRVWYDPLQDLGTTAWPVAGFIYNERDDGQPFGGARVLTSASYQAPVVRPPISDKPSKKFAKAFAGLGEPRAVAQILPARVATVASPVRRVASARTPLDPIEAAIARYGN
jgi:hypothetical protein